MGFISRIRDLFGSTEQGASSTFPSEEYRGFLIDPEPMREGEGFRVSGWIRQGEREHRFIRADLLPTEESCAQETLRKARVLIDQQGDRLFG
jgi:hypothetical protein